MAIWALFGIIFMFIGAFISVLAFKYVNAVSAQVRQCKFNPILIKLSYNVL